MDPDVNIPSFTNTFNSKSSLISTKSIYQKIVCAFFYSTLNLSIVAAAITYSTQLLLGIPINLSIIVAAGLITYPIYVLDRISGFKEDFQNNVERAIFIKKYKPIQLMSAAASYLLGIILLLPGGIIAPFIASLTLLAGLFYGTNFVPKSLNSKYKRFKQVFLIKNIFIATFWTIGVVGVNIAYSLPQNLIFILTTALFIFVKVFLNTIVFDIRDVEGDIRNKIKTLPANMGLTKSLLFLKVGNLLIGFFLICMVATGWLKPIALFVGAGIIYTHWYLSKIQKNTSPSFYDIYVENEDIVMALSGFLGTMLIT